MTLRPLPTTPPDTLLMWSGGLDSTFCLWRRVQAGLATRVHHVVLKDSEGRQEVEAKATRDVGLWLYAHGGIDLIKYTESHVDFQKAWVPANHHLWAYWCGAIMASPAGRHIRNVVIPRHADAFAGEPPDGPAARASDAAYLGHIALMAPDRIPTLTFPVLHMMKADIVAAMPDDLLKLCWWCRMPRGGQPCHSCYTCQLVDAAMEVRQ